MLFSQRRFDPYGGRSICFDSDDPGGTSTAAGNGVVELAKELLNKQGSEQKVARLLTKVAQLESDNQQLQNQVNQLQESAPGEGAVVLEGEEAELYQTMQSEDTSLQDVLDKASEADELKSKLDGMENKSKIERVAEVSGIKAGPLERYLGDLDYSTETIQVEKDGETTQEERAYVTYEDENGETKKREVTSYIQEKEPDLVPALIPSDDDGKNKSQQTQKRSNQQFTPFPQQPNSSSTGGGGGDDDLSGKVDEYVSNANGKSDKEGE